MNPSILATISIFVGLSAVVVSTKMRIGYLISPFSVSILMLVAIFGVRPLVIDYTSGPRLYGYDTNNGVAEATLIGLIAILAVICGYIMLSGLKIKRETKPEPGPTEMSTAAAVLSTASIKTIFIGCFAYILLWAAIMAIRGGGVDALVGMAGGRSASSSRILENLPLVIYCLPAASTLTASAWRLMRERTGLVLKSSEKIGYWLIVVIALLPPLMLGNRRFILPCVVAALIAANSNPKRWNAKIKIWQLALSVLVFTLLAIVPFVRSSGSRSQGDSLFGALVTFVQTEGLSGALTNFFTSYDTEMLDYIAYVVPRLGGDLDYGLGRGTLQDIITSVIPARLEVAPSWSNEILITLFGEPCGVGICPVPSFAGTAFFDFGYLGVAIFGIIVGMLAKLFESAIQRRAGFGLLAVLILGALPATAIRGNYPSQVWIAANMFLTTCVLIWAIARVTQLRTSRNMTNSLGGKKISKSSLEPNSVLKTSIL